ncbi:MAG: site-specific DNA-methyltransferase [Candidatus Thiodiazotropha lotti]|nr:site-specific DNA-methyltransferase [Candidatus Thiodiazotropha lotti]
MFYENQVHDISNLIPYVNNSRTHSDEQIAQIAASIEEWGFTNPVLIDEKGHIIAGHGRVLAAQKLNMKSCPCIVLDGLTKAQKKAYVIADNRLALNASWNNDLLKLEMQDLSELGFDLNLTGFEKGEIDELLSEQTDGLTDEDAVPEVSDNPVSVIGDIWVIGNHRVMCGDSTSLDAVDSLLNGAKVDLIFTDPPYGMNYGGGRAKGKDSSLPGGRSIKAHGMIIGDNLNGDSLLKMVADSIGNAVVSAKSGSALYVCFTWRTYGEFLSALSSIGKEPKSCIVWDKKRIGLGNSNYRPQHEFIFYCGGQWYGDKGQSDVWCINRDAASGYIHPTQKPVGIIEKAINNSSKAGDIVHDCFGGSGSTLIACEKTSRNAYLMELDPKYVDVIVKRWQEFTGKHAILEATGKTFEEVANGGTQSDSNSAKNN